MVQYQNMEPIYEESDLETLTTKNALTSADIQKLCVPLYDQMVSQGMILEGEANTAIYQTIDVPAFRSLQNLWTEENLDLFQAIVCLSMLRYAQDYLDAASYARAHGITEELNLKDIAMEYMRMYAKPLTEQAYADAFVTPEQRSLVKELTEEYKQALAERMEQCPWLSEESRKNLTEKASSIQVTVVTSEERVDYEPLLNKLSAGDISLLDAVIQYDLTNQRFLLNVAEHPFMRSHRARFIHGMLDVNAVYEPDKNSIFVMAGMLRNGFYNDSSRETLLATIGQTIAHEIGHGFDANGVQYDAVGAYNSVLTEEDQSKYKEKLMRIAEELSSLEVADGVFENGMRVLNEAEADLLGLQLTLDLAKKTEGFDYDLFFRTQARKFFRAFKTVDSALDNYSSDQHPAYFIRINYTFAQFGEFYRAYPSVQEGTPMYYAPADRETLW